MDFSEIVQLTEDIILEKRSYKHRPGYKKNEKGSYLEKGKTKWSYPDSLSDFKPGNERIVSQIQSKMIRFYNADASREEIKKYLKTSDSQKLYDGLVRAANDKFGHDEDNKKWRGFVYGIFTTKVAKKLSEDKPKGARDLL